MRLEPQMSQVDVTNAHESHVVTSRLTNQMVRFFDIRALMLLMLNIDDFQKSFFYFKYVNLKHLNFF